MREPRWVQPLARGGWGVTSTQDPPVMRRGAQGGSESPSLKGVIKAEGL